jgi:ATP-dependent Lon protease
MSETRVIERNPTGTVIRTGTNGQQITIPTLLPILPIRNIVVFPGTVRPLNVGRKKSKNLLDEVMPGDKIIGVITQKNPDVEDPAAADLHPVGVACMILKLFKLPDGNQSIIVQGLTRFRLLEMTQTEPFAMGRIEVLEDALPSGAELEALIGSVRQQANRVIELSPNTPDEAAQVLAGITSPDALADFLAANLESEAPDKQLLLEELDVYRRLNMIAARLAGQLDVLELQSKIQSQVKENIDKNQRRYYLQEQLKAIRKELGEGDAGGMAEVDTLRQRLEDARPPEAVMKEANRELGRLDSIPPASPEYGVIRTYLQILSELPWSVTTEDKLDLVAAGAVLDRDHFDLDKVKRRIIEYLAVRKLKPDGGGAILCFLGPPGVGKTSLGKSIAEAMNRKFIRVALGGVRDEADIRGHRRTYIGSMPGRIIAELRKCGSRNPVMMLDEIDKLGADFRGDPASALLEVLDPAQNHTFTDHYLDVPFDLSKVLFIATSNSMDPVPGPLRDRMEVIEIPGYTDADKLSIAQTYLVPRQLEANGLSEKQARFRPDALKLIVESYTREAGVRNLERNVGAVARSIAAEVVHRMTAHALPAAGEGVNGAEVREARAPGSIAKRRSKRAAGAAPAAEPLPPPLPVAAPPSITIDKAYVQKVLGPVRYDPELASRTSVPGVATGLAYTPVGGEILFIEASRYPGKGHITLTGQIGDVMKESATAAYTLVRSRASELGIDPKVLAESDFHIHVPAGAIPKDGPSAGVAMFTALASLMVNRPVRHDVAMTGEITLRGLVLPIGGIKEKSLAAARAGIREIILPARNEKDFLDIPEDVRRVITFHFVKDIEQVLKYALGTGVVAAPRKATARLAKRGRRARGR